MPSQTIRNHFKECTWHALNYVKHCDILIYISAVRTMMEQSQLCEVKWRILGNLQIHTRRKFISVCYETVDFL